MINWLKRNKLVKKNKIDETQLCLISDKKFADLKFIYQSVSVDDIKIEQ